MPAIALPTGLTARPLTADDAPAVTELVADCEVFDDGAREIDQGDIVALWNRPGVDLASSSVGVFEGDALAAAADVHKGRAEVDVHPDHRGRGIGTALLPWTWSIAREQGAAKVGQTVSDRRADAPTLFRRHGYEPRWTSWLLVAEIEEAEEAGVPEGYALRDLEYSEDARRVYEVVEGAFNEWPDREPESFEEWEALTGSHEALAPWASSVVERDGRIVGAAIVFDYADNDEGWIHQLAVHREHRGKGLGRALLARSFRSFRDQGRVKCGLSTDSRTGALTLYEHVGMHVRSSYTHWSKSLDSDD